MGLLSRLTGRLTRAAEGAPRPGPYVVDGGMLSATAGRFMNWWQMGASLSPLGEANSMVEACVSAYAQTAAMCPGIHKRRRPGGGYEDVEDSALARIMRQPNDYSSMSDVLLNLVRGLQERGAGYALAIRNARNEPAELHWMPHGLPMVGPQGEIFYYLSGNEIAERRFDLSAPIPARDVLHVRLHTPRHPLMGVSPILATVLERQMAGAALNQQVAFYLNQARPSYILETDQGLTADVVAELRQRWEEQTRGANAGGTPILAWGLKAKPVTINANDARLADLLKLSNQSIALAFRIPLQILGIGDTPFASTEALMAAWKSAGLGFALNHVEEAFGRLFGLRGQPYEYLELDTDALMRSAFKDRMEALSKGVMSGIYSPDEARGLEGLAPVPGGGGAEPRVQEQVVPLSYALTQPAQPATPAPPAADPQSPPGQTEPNGAANASRAFSSGDILARIHAHAGLH